LPPDSVTVAFDISPFFEYLVYFFIAPPQTRRVNPLLFSVRVGFPYILGTMPPTPSQNAPFFSLSFVDASPRRLPCPFSHFVNLFSPPTKSPLLGLLSPRGGSGFDRCDLQLFLWQEIRVWGNPITPRREAPTPSPPACPFPRPGASDLLLRIIISPPLS